MCISKNVPLHLVIISIKKSHWSFKKYIFLNLFLERGEGKEKEGEKNQRVVASCVSLIGYLACNPGMCPDWESNQRPVGLQPMLNPLSYTSQGCYWSFNSALFFCLMAFISWLFLVYFPLNVSTRYVIFTWFTMYLSPVFQYVKWMKEWMNIFLLKKSLRGNQKSTLFPLPLNILTHIY